MHTRQILLNVIQIHKRRKVGLKPLLLVTNFSQHLLASQIILGNFYHFEETRNFLLHAINETWICNMRLIFGLSWETPLTFCNRSHTFSHFTHKTFCCKCSPEATSFSPSKNVDFTTNMCVSLLNFEEREREKKREVVKVLLSSALWSWKKYMYQKQLAICFQTQRPQIFIKWRRNPCVYFAMLNF